MTIDSGQLTIKRLVSLSIVNCQLSIIQGLIFMRKFILLSLATALLSGLISEFSLIDVRSQLVALLLYLITNLIFYLAYKYDDLFIKSFKKLLDYLLIKDAESFNLAIIFMWISFNLFVIVWRWSNVR